MTRSIFRTFSLFKVEESHNPTAHEKGATRGRRYSPLFVPGILKKRVDENWQIGADATICYAHGLATQDCGPSEVFKYLYDDNKYNTRVIEGMPMGPIANPEAEVIDATINSKSSPYYFYLHDNS